MNPLKYAIACQKSYQPDNPNWIKTWFINGVWISLTRIDGDYVLVLRGSMTAEDWLRDVVAIPDFHYQLGWCHQGFMNGMDDVFNAVRNATGGEPCSFAGHSLGGARARLLAGLFVVNKLPVKNLCVFGSPKPAFPQLAEIIESSGINHLSFRNNNDIVPMMPETIPPIFDFVHTEEFTTIDGGVEQNLESLVKDHSIDLYINGLTSLAGE